jgi:hypothetical protein
MTKRLFLTLAIMLVTVTHALAADILYPNVAGSHPSADNANTPVEQGRKGILLTMQCLEPSTFAPKDTCWPLASGTPSLSINGGAAITCSMGLSPAPNACGYAIGRASAADPFIDTFRMVYNANFPSNASVAVTVTGATGNAGSAESTTCPSDPLCTLHFTTGSNTPRQTTSAELVFDISGSMSQLTVPGGTTQRIAALKKAAKVFIESYQPKTMLGDKLGAVFFSTDATSVPAGTPNFVAGLDTTAVNNLWNQINAQVPTNATAIGKALQLANTNGFAADAGSTNAKWAFLFTDGIQNVPPDVSVSGPQLQVGGAAYSTSAGAEPASGQIWVCPITAGRMTAPGFTLLQNIANAFCNGQNTYINSASEDFAIADLQSGFVQRFATMLHGDKFEISRDITSTVTATPEVRFLANALDKSLEIILTYDPRAERASYRLIAPDGTEVPLQPRRFGGGNVANIEFPVMVGTKKIATEGEWKIVFIRETFGQAPLNYHLMVVNDNPTISTAFKATGTDFGTGDPLTLRATILDDGRPIPDATVTATVAGPAAALGDALSRARVSSEIPNLQGDIPGSAGARKLLSLYNDREAARLFGTRPLPSLTLSFCEQSQPGCGYAASIANPDLEGHYHITFVARGKSLNNGEFERTWKLAVFVRPKPDPATTTVNIRTISRRANGTILATLRVTARDRLRRLLGPAYDGALAFATRERVIPFASDNLDGSYEFRITTPRGQPKIELRVLGQPVKTIDLSHGKRGQDL